MNHRIDKGGDIWRNSVFIRASNFGSAILLKTYFAVPLKKIPIGQIKILRFNKKFIGALVALAAITFFCNGQTCGRKDASGCSCKDTSSKNCYLLPDLTVSKQAITDTFPLGYIEYPQKGAGINYPGQGNDDGRIRITIATPNIGYGPLHILGTDTFVCGADTFATYPDTCGNGKVPSRLILQRIYQKDQDTMRYFDRISGTMTYHPFHKHIHVDDWTWFSLRNKNPAEPDPLKWPIIGKGAKMGYCLMDLGNCSMHPDWCRNNSDSIPPDSLFANSGFGKFGGDCGIKEQGISSGYFDVYTSNLYEMWLDIPPGTCNGIYYLVVVVDPLNHFTESDETNNLIVVPVTLKKQDPLLQPLTRILADKPPVICKGDSITLNAAGAVSYTWSTGENTQSISVKTPGLYSVKANLACGAPSFDSITITTIDPPLIPVLKSDTVCKGDSAKLVSENADTLRWYESAQTENVIHTGSSFSTPPLFSSRTYYAEKSGSLPEKIYHAAKIDTIGKGEYFPEGEYLMFDCFSPIILDSVTFFAAAPRQDTIPLYLSLHSEFGGLIDRAWFNLYKGKNTVALGFQIPPGKYQLYFPNRGDSIFCNTGGFYYPLEIPGVISVTNSSEGKDKYFYFYNWVIRAAGTTCTSSRVPVTAVVDTSCTVIGLQEWGGTLYEVSVFPNPVTGSALIQINAAPLNGNYILHLVDYTGREISTMSSSENQFILQKGALASGLYIYRINLENTLISLGKLMVE